MANIRIKDLTTTASTPAGDDYCELDGSTNGGRKLAMSFFADRFASRQGADYLYSDGATTNRRIETVYGTVGNVAGSDLTLVDYVFDVPTSNPSSTAIIWSITGDNTNPGDLVANTLYMALGTTGNLSIRQYGATTSDWRLLLWSGWRTSYSGRRIRVTVAFSGNSTTSPTVWIDGVDVSSSFALTTNGTVPNWVATTLGTTYFLQGHIWPAGYFRPGRPVNRKYAQSDVDFVQVTGRLPWIDSQGGSAVELLPNGNFSLDPTVGANGGWTLDAGVTWNSGAGTIDFSLATGGFLRSSTSAVAWCPSIYSLGRAWRIAFTISNYSSGTLNLTDSGASPLTQTSGSAVPGITANGTYTYDVVNRSSRFMFGSFSGVFTGSIDNVSIKLIGALSDPIIQHCNVLDDATPNNKASLLVGFSPVTTRKDWRIPAYVDMSSTGNKQLLSGAVFTTPTAQAIDTIETTCTGTPTFSIGDGTTATKYTASVAHSAGRLRETLSANFPADSAKTGLYANVTVAHASSTAELIIVRGHRQ